MFTKTITILITPKAEVSIDAVGFVGKECDAVTAALKKALGTEVAGSRVNKPEYHRQQEVKSEVKVKS